MVIFFEVSDDKRGFCCNSKKIIKDYKPFMRLGITLNTKFKLGQELSYVENNPSVPLVQGLSVKQEATTFM